MNKKKKRWVAVGMKFGVQMKMRLGVAFDSKLCVYMVSR